MAQFSTKERIIARFLSSAPGLKRLIKNCYIRINALIYRKNYRFKLIDKRISEIQLIDKESNQESFFGYYDKSPVNKFGDIIFYTCQSKTCLKPNPNSPIDIWVQLTNNALHHIATTSAYNWQQGARAQWLNDNTIMFNDFSNGKYIGRIYYITNNKFEHIEYPIQDTHVTGRLLSINYSRIMRLRPDYGYRNLPISSDSEMTDLKADGIFDITSGTYIHTLEDICNFKPKEIFKNSLHKVNHVMISPLGDKFIFIHRFYHKGQRFDRLLLSDYSELRVLADNGMVSHMCWVNNETLIGYFRYQNNDGFYFINTNSGEVSPCEPMNALKQGDGHPSCHGDWIVFDSYPDKSRMQHLHLYNYKTKELSDLLEVFHPLKYSGECRCDLHPRFSTDGRSILFDTVYSGLRKLAMIDISKIIIAK